jgi:hypothetical protein
VEQEVQLGHCSELAEDLDERVSPREHRNNRTKHARVSSFLGVTEPDGRCRTYSSTDGERFPTYNLSGFCAALEEDVMADGVAAAVGCVLDVEGPEVAEER